MRTYKTAATISNTIISQRGTDGKPSRGRYGQNTAGTVSSCLRILKRSRDIPHAGTVENRSRSGFVPAQSNGMFPMKNAGMTTKYITATNATVPMLTVSAKITGHRITTIRTVLSF